MRVSRLFSDFKFLEYTINWSVIEEKPGSLAVGRCDYVENLRSETPHHVDNPQVALLYQGPSKLKPMAKSVAS